MQPEKSKLIEFKIVCLVPTKPSSNEFPSFQINRIVGNLAVRVPVRRSTTWLDLTYMYRGEPTRQDWFADVN